MIFRSIEQVRRFSRILAGFTLLLIGAIMLFTPGPGWLTIFLGLTMLAAEFVWARRLMDRMKHEGNRQKDSIRRVNKSEAAKENLSEGKP
jgi:tellurite resistance protein TerC